MINLILSSCTAFIFVHVLQFWTWHPALKRKPFACETCMAGWIALPACWHGFYTPLWMAGAMVLTIILTAYLKKI